jgi:hypothetical protein
MRRGRSVVVVTVVVGCMCATGVAAQRGRGDPPPGPAMPRTSAPFDVTGYWVALITEDWRYRQFTPPKGDYGSVPLSPAGRKIADAWDPAKDEAAGESCKPHGAAGLMRQPTRLHITWQDDTTLKIDADAGTQTRLLYFGEPRMSGGNWQGVSIQRRHRDDGVFRSAGRAWRRRATARQNRDRGSAVPRRSVLDERAIQASERFGRLESDAVRGSLIWRRP